MQESTFPGALESSLTPVMKQYYDLKAQAQDALLFFRMGDFYELFGEDAVEASRLLDITLTSRDRNKENPLPMAGVPFHSVGPYLQKLLKAGKKVAICEQFEEPETPNGKSKAKMVRRELVRILTPGVQFEGLSGEKNYLCLVTSEHLVCLDPSTGELRTQPLKTLSELERFTWIQAKHFLIFENEIDSIRNQVQTLFPHALIEPISSNFVTLQQGSQILESQYRLAAIETWFDTPSLRRSAAALIRYVLKTQRLERLIHLRLPETLTQKSCLNLGPRTAEHLDLLSGMPSFFEWLNRTQSSMGARCLERWLLEPLSTLESIQARTQKIQWMASLSSLKRTQLQELLKEVYDLERIVGRLVTGLASPRDTLGLAKTVNLLHPLLAWLQDALCSKPQPQFELHAQSLKSLDETLSKLGAKIRSEQKEDAPFTSRDGGIFLPLASTELARLLEMVENGTRFLVELETRERTRTGIPSLKVKYNRVFGYFIEVTSTHLKNVPSDYQRKQTTVGGERFFTEELKKFEEEMLTASSKQKALEAELFSKLLEELKSLIPSFMAFAQELGELDALFSLAKLAHEPGFQFAQIDDSFELRIEGGFHPIVQASLKHEGKTMVTNDLRFEDPTRLILVTGPNMGGKSTLLRQLALIVILGQMGAPVPARKAQWGFFDAIYTRLGAHDAIARGQSTFMVEMTELAFLLREATPRSLVILDEIGRGTSTYDGMSVAWATIEHLCSHVKSRTLFATHYHELTSLSQSLTALSNAHMAVSTEAGRLQFRYKLEPGPSSESFGVNVAQMAGLPESVISRSWQILAELEGKAPQKTSLSPLPKDTSSSPQLSFFMNSPSTDPHLEKVGKEISGLRIENLTPLQALTHLAKFQDALKLTHNCVVGKSST